MTYTINILAPFTIGLSIWLGATGRVDWWIIVLIWSVSAQINLKFKRR